MLQSKNVSDIIKKFKLDEKKQCNIMTDNITSNPLFCKYLVADGNISKDLRYYTSS